VREVVNFEHCAQWFSVWGAIIQGEPPEN
jgi:hypothetical protein